MLQCKFTYPYFGGKFSKISQFINDCFSCAYLNSLKVWLIWISFLPLIPLTLGKLFCFGGYAVVEVGFTIVSNRNPSKVAFCQEGVDSILESEVLLQKNAHSHTIRKTTVFAPHSIRHGSGDKYELFFNHFRKENHMYLKKTQG